MFHKTAEKAGPKVPFYETKLIINITISFDIFKHLLNTSHNKAMPLF